ncbi:MAG: hypothetical protein XU08_C0001G0014 [candidate division WWE3 bacterium CSP1-7]|uniref:Uncharacterized protein n=2 Tax=Katanobacteria TaxID=422282 RepID=A0A0T5ZXT1_UNCKA|nr:MAG: hypothetical protein XU08_C0001G0014 [candidate division WWE3 bacterium CSP1-7]
MEPRQVMMLRLSKRWETMEMEVVDHLAKYLYSFYDFLQLSDPVAEYNWGIGKGEDGALFLVLMEFPPKDEGDDHQVPDLTFPDFGTSLRTDPEEEIGDDEAGGLSEEDVDPDSREEESDD